MKICLINNLYKPYSRGGTEVVVENIIEGLKDAGHDVFVITIKSFGGVSSFWAERTTSSHAFVGGRQNPPASLRSATPFDKGELEKSPLEGGEGDVYRFYPLNLFSFINIAKYNALIRFFWHILDVFNLHSYFVVKKILKEEKPNVIMTHNLKGLGYLIPCAIKKSGVKWVHTVHDVQLAVPSGLIIKNNNPLAPFTKGEFGRVPVLIYEKICRWLFNSPDVVVSPSKWLSDFYSERGFFAKSEKVVIPNPVKLETRKLETRDMGQVNFLYLGQIEEHKGILFLINTFEELQNYQLLIAGDGSRLEEIKRVVQDEPRIKILGRVPHEKIAELFSETDFTIVPSLCYENSPTVIYESLFFGVPVVAARIGGVAELVKDRVNGFTFEAGDKEDLLRVLKYCAENKDKLEMRGKTVKSVEDFSVNKYILKLKSLI